MVDHRIPLLDLLIQHTVLQILLDMVPHQTLRPLHPLVLIHLSFKEHHVSYFSNLISLYTHSVNSFFTNTYVRRTPLSIRRATGIGPCTPFSVTLLHSVPFSDTTQISLKLQHLYYFVFLSLIVYTSSISDESYLKWLVSLYETWRRYLIYS